jgi:hypothetical protein
MLRTPSKPGGCSGRESQTSARWRCRCHEHDDGGGLSPGCGRGIGVTSASATRTLLKRNLSLAVVDPSRARESAANMVNAACKCNEINADRGRPGFQRQNRTKAADVAEKSSKIKYVPCESPSAVPTLPPRRLLPVSNWRALGPRSDTPAIGAQLEVLRSVTSVRSVILHLLPVLSPIRVLKSGRGR